MGQIDLKPNERTVCIEMCQTFHTSTQDMAKVFFTRLGRQCYITPTSYLELIKTFDALLLAQRQ